MVNRTPPPPRPAENQDPWYTAAENWSKYVENQIDLSMFTSRGNLVGATNDLNTLYNAEDSGLYYISSLDFDKVENLPPNLSDQTSAVLIWSTAGRAVQVYIGYNVMSWRYKTSVFGNWREVVSSDNRFSSVFFEYPEDVPGGTLDSLPVGDYAFSRINILNHLDHEYGLPNAVGKLQVRELTPTAKIQIFTTGGESIASSSETEPRPYQTYVRGMNYDREWYPDFTKTGGSDSAVDPLNYIPHTIQADGCISGTGPSTTYFEKNVDQPMIPASTTKVFTMFLARELITDSMLDDTVTVLSTDPNPGGSGSNQPLLVGDVVTYRSLLYMAALPSHNQAASILARACGDLLPGGGNGFDRFVQHMTDRSIELGWTESVWVNPTGLGASGNRISPRHLYDLMYMIADDSVLVDIMGTQERTINVEGPNERTIDLSHTVRRSDGQIKFPDLVAAKSGTLTGVYCCVMLYEKSNNGLGVVVVMQSTSTLKRYWDARQAINYSIQAYDQRFLV